MVAYKIELLRLPGPLPQRIDLCALKDREAPVSQALKKPNQNNLSAASSPALRRLVGSSGGAEQRWSQTCFTKCGNCLEGRL